MSDHCFQLDASIYNVMLLVWMYAKVFVSAGNKNIYVQCLICTCKYNNYCGLNFRVGLLTHENSEETVLWSELCSTPQR